MAEWRHDWNGRILCVDDETGVLRAYRDILGDGESRAHAAAVYELMELEGLSSEFVRDSTGPVGFKYDIQLAENGETALRMVIDMARRGEHVAAGFFDMRMPGGMDGLETIREIRKVEPQMLCAVVTAFTDRRVEQIAELFKSRDEWLYINKPFTDGELIQAACHLVASWNYRMERDRALQELEAANVRLEEYNRTLEKKVKEKTRALEDAMAKLEYLSITDGLTGLFVHRHAHDLLEREIARSVEEPRPLSLVLVDVDHFKSVNDDYGHVAGDAVLKEIGVLLRTSLSGEGYAARYGGEEFLLVLPGVGKDAARALAENVRVTVGGYDFNRFCVRRHVTLSLGVSSYPGDATTKVELLKAADEALYLAKRKGRNAVVVAAGS